MKKKVFVLFFCFIFSLVFECSCNDNPDNVADSSQYYMLIESSKYYRIYKDNITTVYFEVLDANGGIVLSETTDRPLSIQMLNSDIVEISIGMGTGITSKRYYSVKRNTITEQYLYVLANFNELIAYIDVPLIQSFEDRRIIVQNLFDKDEFYAEYELDFSNVDTPVIQASFCDSGESLHLIYLSGEFQTQTTTVLKIGT